MKNEKNAAPRFALITMVILVLLTTISSFAAEPLRSAKTPPDLDFDRLHDYNEVVGYLKGWAEAYPRWVRLESLGKTTEGRDTWLMTITNPATGAPESKPAMYVDGNTHANEVQGGEAALYVVDFLLTNYGKLDRATELLDRLTFYVIPMVNPDGRARWFKGPSTMHFPRTVPVAVDDDRDGLFDEDGYDDIDGDGEITQMRKKVPLGQGDYLLDPKDSRILVPVEEDELGDYITLGSEGFDNDGDGSVNEDMIGYVDPNRTWGWGWQPTYVQSGAGQYPLSVPETRNIATWALKHPNIGGIQSFHNNGQMILRGPGAKMHGVFPAEDVEVFDFIAKQGEEMIPGYKYLISWKDLYTTYGDTTDHFYKVAGAISYTNELYEAPVDLDGDGEVTDEERLRFNDILTGGRQFKNWEKVSHPQYGEIEIGGYRHNVDRVPEGWLLEEDMHRNALFVLFHAWHLPKISLGEAEVQRVDRNLYKIYVPVLNERATPTMLSIAKRNNLSRADIASVTGAKVVASGIVQNKYLDKIKLQEHRPGRLMVDGIDGVSTRELFFLVEGSGDITVEYDSLKGGKISRKFSLR